MNESPVEKEVDPQAEMFAACSKVLRAGRWLMLNGWGRMLMVPYFGPTGFWRCAFHPLGKPSREFYRYTSGSAFHFLADHCGGSVRRNIGAKQLAEAIVKSVPEDIRELFQGRCSPELQRWLDELDMQLARGVLPFAFHEYTEDHSRWGLYANGNALGESMPPPPGYVVPGSEPQWHEQPFWREALARAHQLEHEEEFLFSFRHAENFEDVARELALLIKEEGTSVAVNALKAAIAKLA